MRITAPGGICEKFALLSRLPHVAQWILALEFCYRRCRWLRDQSRSRLKTSVHSAPNRQEIHMSQGDPSEPVVEQAPTEQAPAATEQSPVEQAPEEQQQVAATEPEPVAAPPVADPPVGSDSPATEA